MTSDTDSTIEGLLQQRAQFEQWLARLESAGDKAPAAVRTRIRSDYEARLRGVIEQLRGHAATITEELERHKSTQAGLDQERRSAEEQLAEAELRHAVGEFAEDEWRRISDRSNEQLNRLRGELRGVGEEIARLAEVQSLIGGPPKRVEAPPPPPAHAAPPPAPPPPVAQPAPQVRHYEPEPRPEPPPPVAARPAPRPAPPPREPEITHGPPEVDELAFLKSVAEEKPAPAAPAPRRGSSQGGGGTSPSGRAEAPTTTSPGKPGATGVAKTLKCGECGTLNRPTEWYCERCGAELAGI